MKPRKKILPKNRTLPYRVLALLQFARYPWIARRPAADGLSVEVRFLAGQFRIALNITNRDRLYTYLTWLEARQLVAGVVVDKAGRVSCRVPMPRAWNEWDFPGWALKNGRIPGQVQTTYADQVRAAREALVVRETMAGELVAVRRESSQFAEKESTNE